MAKVSKRRGHHAGWGSYRATLKQHLEGAWVRKPYGQQMPPKSRVRRPKSWRDPSPPARLGDVWTGKEDQS